MAPSQRNRDGRQTPTPGRERTESGGLKLLSHDPREHHERHSNHRDPELRSSFILTEGSAAEAGMTTVEKMMKWTYVPWNSIPIRYTPVIAWELGKALLKRMFKGGNPLNLQPNYLQLNFTPLEMSFTRRPNGFMNLIRDIIDRKPFCLLSDMRDGYLYSPDGGSLRNIFPRATAWMLDNPVSLMILKRERTRKLAEAVAHYQSRYANPTKLPTDGLFQAVFDALVEVGKTNAKIFYMYGFGDTQLEIGEEEIRKLIRANAKTTEDAKGLIDAIEGFYTKRAYLDIPDRGYKGVGKWMPTIEFEVMKYKLPDLRTKLTNNKGAFGIFESFPGDVKEKLSRAFKMREEGVQEGYEATKAIEYCRSTFYRLADRLSELFKVEVRFLIAEELPEIKGGDAAYASDTLRRLRETSDRRKAKLEEFSAR